MELNPNHRVTAALHEQWHKVAYLIMRKTGIERLEITAEDLERFMAEPPMAIAGQDKDGKLTIFLLPMEKAEELARKEGGLLI
jgi:hypothetical protein